MKNYIIHAITKKFCLTNIVVRYQSYNNLYFYLCSIYIIFTSTIEGTVSILLNPLERLSIILLIDNKLILLSRIYNIRYRKVPFYEKVFVFFIIYFNNIYIIYFLCISHLFYIYIYIYIYTRGLFYKDINTVTININIFTKIHKYICSFAIL